MSLENILAWDARFTAGIRVAEKPGPLRTLAAVLAHSGDSWFWLLGLFLIWWRAGPFWQLRALALGVGVVVTALLVMSLKFTVRRRRPEGEWGNIYRKTDPHSFPSGHAARAAMLATISLGMGPPWLALFLVIWAPMVGLARVAMGVHYLSDVIAGVVLGVIVGSAVLVFT